MFQLVVSRLFAEGKQEKYGKSEFRCKEEQHKGTEDIFKTKDDSLEADEPNDAD